MAKTNRAVLGNTPTGKPDKAKCPTKKAITATAIQSRILEVKAEHPDLSVREIAAVADTSHSYVVETLQKFGIAQTEVEHYKTHRADVFAGLQYRLLASATDEDIKKAPLGSRILAACQIYDKERLERGQATANIGIGLALSAPLQDAVDRIVSRLNISLDSSPVPHSGTNDPMCASTPTGDNTTIDVCT